MLVLFAWGAIHEWPYSPIQTLWVLSTQRIADPPPSVRRLRATPLVEHGSIAGYGAVFNAGLIHHEGRFHLIARAVREGYRANPDPGPRFLDYISDIVVLTSDDGESYSFDHVLARAGDHGVHCWEDPRIQQVLDNGSPRLLMTYTNLPAEDSGLPWRIGAHEVAFRNGRLTLDAGSGVLLGPDGVENKDAVIFNLSDGRVGLIHRVYPSMQLAVFDDVASLWAADAAYWDDHLEMLDHHTIITPSAGAFGVGAGAPPVETEAGLLLLFHERDETGAYTMRAALLDPHTGRVIAVMAEPVLEPELPWECEGDVDRVIFVQGVHRLDADTLYVVYGAADSHIGAVVVSIERLVNQILGR